MYVNIAVVLSVVALAVAKHVDERPFAGVDPNTLQCDPKGQKFLLLPHFHDCNKFFICAHGIEVPQFCSPGTIFDFELQGCAWPFNGKCILRDKDFEGSGSDEDESSGLWPLNESDINSEAEKASSHAVFMNSLDCLKPASASQRKSYKGDCQRYWRCSSGVLQSAYCTDGLFFNSQTEQCDFEANVKCDTELVNELDGEFMVYN